jgi:hypothetical protein
LAVGSVSPTELFLQHNHKTSSWEKVRLGKLNIDEYKNDVGFELIAHALAEVRHGLAGLSDFSISG